MLKSEFEERTKKILTQEEYEEVEDMYLSVTIDKDEFCKQWLALKDNKLVKELYETIKLLRGDCKRSEEVREGIEAEYVLLKTSFETKIDEIEKSCQKKTEEFANEIIKACECDLPASIYDAIEKEFGVDFIIKSKWSQDMNLSKEEITYLVNKID